jgi:uncharacterized protein (TIGR03083 family)
MLHERAVDCAALYANTRRKLIAQAQGFSPEQLAANVPATPLWSVHDVISHLVGITADLNALNFGTGDADAWTEAQVARRRGASLEELSAEWELEGPKFQDGLSLFGYELGSHYMGDLLQHVADINQALGLARLADDEALAVALDFYLDDCHESLCEAGVGSVELHIGAEKWSLGSGPTTASLRTYRFEAFRCLGGRRSEHQIRDLDWSGELD